MLPDPTVGCYGECISIDLTFSKISIRISWCTPLHTQGQTLHKSQLSWISISLTEHSLIAVRLAPRWSPSAFSCKLQCLDPLVLLLLLILAFSGVRPPLVQGCLSSPPRWFDPSSCDDPQQESIFRRSSAPCPRPSQLSASLIWSLVLRWSSTGKHFQAFVRPLSTCSHLQTESGPLTLPKSWRFRRICTLRVPPYFKCTECNKKKENGRFNGRTAVWTTRLLPSVFFSGILANPRRHLLLYRSNTYFYTEILFQSGLLILLSLWTSIQASQSFDASWSIVVKEYVMIVINIVVLYVALHQRTLLEVRFLDLPELRFCVRRVRQVGLLNAI